MPTLRKRLLPALQLCSVLFVALCLVPAGAHLFEFPNKLKLSDPDYLLVQQIYRGWWLFALAVLPALVLTLAHAVVLRDHVRRFAPALAAFLCMLTSQGIFWLWTYPANRETESWTQMPANFAALRDQWEYSHAVAACLVFGALAFLMWSILERPGSIHARHARPTLVQGRTVYRIVRTIRR